MDALFYNAVRCRQSEFSMAACSSLRSRDRTVEDENLSGAPIFPSMHEFTLPRPSSSSFVATDPALMFVMRQRGRRLWSLDTAIPQHESRPSRARLTEIVQEAIEISSGHDLDVATSTIDGQDDSAAEENLEQQQRPSS